MKIKLILSVLLINLSISFFACNKSEDINQKQEKTLIGTWENSMSDDKQVLVFNSDKTFKIEYNLSAPIVAVGGYSYINLPATISGNWIYNDDKIIVSNTKVELSETPNTTTNLPVVPGNPIGSLYLTNLENGNIIIDNLPSSLPKNWEWEVKQLSQTSLTVDLNGTTMTFTKAG